MRVLNPRDFSHASRSSPALLRQRKLKLMPHHCANFPQPAAEPTAQVTGSITVVNSNKIDGRGKESRLVVPIEYRYAIRGI